MAMTQKFLDSLVGKKLDEAKKLCDGQKIKYEVCPIGYQPAPEVVPTSNKVTIWIQPSGYVDHLEPWDPSDVEA